MRIIAKSTLRKFWESSAHYFESKAPIEAWYAEAKKAKWQTPQDIKKQFHTVSILKNSRAIFNIGGNKYRLIVSNDYCRQTIFIRFIGTHQQYNKINAEVI